MSDEPTKPESEPPYKLRWYQYKLSTLLFVVIPVCAIVFAIFGYKLQQARQQRVAVAAIRNLGGSVFYDYQLDEQGKLIPEKKQQPPGWEWERKLLGIDMLADVVAVFFFNTGDEEIGDEEMKHLAEMTELEWLILMNTQVGDAGLKHLTEITEMKRLFLSCTQVGDEGMKHLAGMTNLNTLYLSKTQVGSEGMRHLAGMTKLETLYLDYTQVGDPGLKHLARMTNLKTLLLNDTQVSNEGIEHLAVMEELTYLLLSRTQVTAEGVAELQKSLPNCEIVP